MICERSTTPTAKPARSYSPARVEAGQLRGLAAEQRAAGLLAALGDALHHLGALLRLELAGGEVVEEEERLGARARAMSFTHIATRSMPTVSWRPAAKATLSLVPTPSVPETSTGSRYLPGVEREEPAEAADAGQHLGAERRAGVGLDALDERVALVDVHARVAVGERHGAPYRDGAAAASRSGPRGGGEGPRVARGLAEAGWGGGAARERRRGLARRGARGSWSPGVAA